MFCSSRFIFNAPFPPCFAPKFDPLALIIFLTLPKGSAAACVAMTVRNLATQHDRVSISLLLGRLILLSLLSLHLCMLLVCCRKCLYHELDNM